MKYRVEGRYRTTEDNKYTIILNYVTKDYTIRDNENKKVLTQRIGDLDIPMTFNKLKEAKEYIKNLY